MADLAVALLSLQGASNLLADLGCGSGLSAAALSRHAGVGAWVGTDITPAMVQLAAAQPGSAGRVLVSDFGQGLPLRPACLDGAISISAVQWLCSAPHPSLSIRRFFTALHSSLRPGARAALQVYPEDDAHAQQLVAGAEECGLEAGLFVAFPHSTPAKKYYVLVERPQEAAQLQQRRLAPLSCRACNLAWPKTGSCILSWAQRLQQQRQQLLPAVASLAEPASRMQQEHASLGKRMVRLLRLAVSASEPAASRSSNVSIAGSGSSGSGIGSAAGGGGGTATGTGNGSAADGGGGTATGTGNGSAADGGGGTGTGTGTGNGSPAGGGGGSSGSGGASGPLVVHAELEAQHAGLMPCGGPIFVQLTAAASLLCTPACSHDSSKEGSQASLTAGAAEASASAAEAPPPGAAAGASFDSQRFAAAAEAVARGLLSWQAGPAGATHSSSGAEEGEGRDTDTGGCRRVRAALVKLATAEDAALHCRQQPAQQFAAPGPPLPPPPEGSSGLTKAPKAPRAHQFMRLEPLQAVQQGQGQGQGLAAAVLLCSYAHKMAQHLVLRISCSHSSGGGGGRSSPCGRSSGSGGGSQQYQVLRLSCSSSSGCAAGGGGGGGDSCASWHCCAAHVAQRMQALCAELNGCVVGLDAHVFPDRVDATWVVFLEGLQQLERADLAAAVRRHFAAAAGR